MYWFSFQVCQVCVKYIHNVYDTIIVSLDGRNVEIFLEEFGLSVQKYAFSFLYFFFHYFFLSSKEGKKEEKLIYH